MSQFREHWSSRFGFVMAALGSAVGLGILWKFPYTVGNNGGGLFLLCYFFCVILLGIPLFIGELILGRSSQRAAVGAFAHHHQSESAWRVTGWLGLLSSFLIMSFYSVIAGWGMSYVLMSIQGFNKGLSAIEVSNVFSELSRSGGISLFWHFLFTFLTTMIVITGVRKGIEHWAKTMTRILLVILFCLFFFSISLDGFSKAARFMFVPDITQFNFSSVIEALGLAFFTLSLGQGIMISYGSYLKQGENAVRMALIVSFSVIVVAILAALTIFPVVFTFGFFSKSRDWSCFPNPSLFICPTARRPCHFHHLFYSFCVYRTYICDPPCGSCYSEFHGAVWASSKTGRYSCRDWMFYIWYTERIFCH